MSLKSFIVTFFAVLCLSLSLAAIPCFAQVPIGVGPGNGDGQSTPIGGMAVLAALGGGYALKKLRDKKRES